MLYVSACFEAGWLWPADKSLRETSSPTVCCSIKVRRWTRIIVTAHRGAAQLFKWIPALLFSVRALKNTTGSSKVALGAAVTRQRYYTCASCRTAKIILLAHMNTVAVIQCSAILMWILYISIEIDDLWFTDSAGVLGTHPSCLNATAIRSCWVVIFFFGPLAQRSSLKCVFQFCVVKKMNDTTIVWYYYQFVV